MKRLLLTQVVTVCVFSALSQQVATAQRPSATLHQAAMLGNLDQVKSLVAGGADIDALDRQGWTPLSTAIRRQQKEIAEYLIAKGADVKIPDRGGVRVEDNVIVTETGGESLSTYNRQLEVIA